MPPVIESLIHQMLMGVFELLLALQWDMAVIPSCTPSTWHQLSV